MSSRTFLAAAVIAVGIISTIVSVRAQTPPKVVLANVSYGATRELHRAPNDAIARESKDLPANSGSSCRSTTPSARAPYVSSCPLPDRARLARS